VTPPVKGLECPIGATQSFRKIYFGSKNFGDYYDETIPGKTCIPAPIRTKDDFDLVQAMVGSKEECWVGAWETENDGKWIKEKVGSKWEWVWKPDTNNDWFTTTGGSLFGLPGVIPAGDTSNPPFVNFNNDGNCARMTSSGMRDKSHTDHFCCGIYLCCDKVVSSCQLCPVLTRLTEAKTVSSVLPLYSTYVLTCLQSYVLTFLQS
jgi:hypothetical protein